MLDWASGLSSARHFLQPTNCAHVRRAESDDRVDVEHNPMSDAMAFDNGFAFFAVEREGHGENRLERVALRASGR